MDDLWDVRPEECNAYMPHRADLHLQNAELWRTGMVVMTQGPPHDDIPGLFARRLARQFGGHPVSLRFTLATQMRMPLLCLWYKIGICYNRLCGIVLTP